MKELIKLLRQLGVSSEALPDSASPEDVGKFVEKQGASLKIINPDDVKARQKKLSERDVELKKIQEKKEENLGEKDLKDQLNAMLVAA